MIQPIFSDGKEYISAIRAAKKIGYASDYIGQLCRAKKIPGELIGKSWYVDFAFLVEHKKNRKLGKPPLEKKLSEVIPLKSVSSTVFTYENDDGSQLPELSKKDRYVEPIWNARLFQEAAAISLALLVAVGAGFFTLERTAPSVATEVRQNMENIFDTFSFAESFGGAKQLAAVSFFDPVGKFFESLVASFRHLKELALNKFFFARAPIKITETVSPPPVAITETTKSLDLTSLKSELKVELESYVRGQIDSILPRQGGASSPIVVYSSSPTPRPNDGSVGQVATSDFESFKTNEVIPAIHYVVDNQSDADADRLSVRFSRLTNDGTFIKATFDTICFSADNCRTNWPSGGSGGDTFAWTTQSWGVSTSTTLGFLNGFLSTASSTIDSNLIITGNSTTTSATSTSFFGGQITGNQLRIGGSATSTINTSGDLLVVGSTTLQNFTATNSTSTSATTTNFFSTTASSTNLFSSLLTVGGTGLVVDSSRNVGIGTTSPWGKLSVTQTGTGGAPAFIVEDSASPDTTPFIIDQTGNVGIGTTEPLRLLHIENNTSDVTDNSQLRIDNDGVGDAYIYLFAGADWSFGIDNSDSDKFKFSTSNDVSDGTEVLTLDRTGLVGIGTTTPTWLLNPSSATAAQLALSAGAGVGQWAFRNAGGNLYFATTTVAGNATTSTSALTIIGSSGNVGIATTSPYARLAVSGVTGDNIPQLVIKANSGQASTTPSFVLYQSDGYPAIEMRAGGLGVNASNTFIGVNSGKAITTGTDNTAVGYDSLISNTTGTNNSAFGASALLSNTTGIKNSAFGRYALLSNTTGVHNAAFGNSSLQQNTTGQNNSAFGRTALESSTTGDANAGFGHNALAGNTTGSYNSAFGSNALAGNTTGFWNTAVGRLAGQLVSTGGGNVLLGYQAGNNMTTASSSIIIGFDIDAPSATANNQLNIGNLIFGTGLDGIGSTLSTGSIGIGTTTPTWLLNPSSATAAQLALSAGAGVGQWAFRNAGGNLYFATTTVAGNATTSTSALTIIGSSGNVGIGTTSPGSLLSVSGSSGLGLVNTGTGNTFYAYDEANDASPFVIDNAGNVGIGTTSPYAKLSVVGETVSAYFTATTTTNNTFPNLIFTSATGTAATTTNFAVSGIASALLKTNSTGSLLAAIAGTDFENPLTFSTGLTRSTDTVTVDQAFSPTWTGAHIFNNITRATSTQATSTNFFSGFLNSNSLRIGGSATSTINTSGDLLVVGSTTLQNFTAVNSTSTSATTTNFFSTTASSTNLFGTTGNLSTLTINSSASIPALSNLTSNGFVKTSGSNGTLSIDTTTFLSSYDAWTHPSAGVSATTSSMIFTNASSTFTGNLNITGNSTTTSATSTNFAVSGIASALLKTNSTGSLLAAIAGTDFENPLTFSTGLTRSTDTVTVDQAFSPTWTGAHIFNNITRATSTQATSTNFFSGFLNSNSLRIGGSATSTINTSGDLLVVGSTTLQNFTFLNATGTQATTTSLAITNLSAADCDVKALTNGSIYCGTDATGGSGGGNSKFATSTGEYLGISPNGGTLVNLGVGTTTPIWALTVSSSTGPQLALTDASLTSSVWTQRSAGGNLYFATSSPSTFATTSTSALTIIGSTGRVGIGTTTPRNLIQVNDLINFPNDISGTFIGYQAGNVTGGINNTFVGYQSGLLNTTGASNSAFGSGALDVNTTASNNSAFGLNSLGANTTGASNSAFGSGALDVNTTASNNSAFGLNSLGANTTGASNSAFGSGALDVNTTASNNSAFGLNTLGANTTGASNSAFGSGALDVNTTANDNSAFGLNALGANTVGASNSAFGSGALDVNTTSNNSAFGFNSLGANTTGTSNSAFGKDSLGANTTGASNSAFGLQALLSNTTGASNSAFGFQALLFNTTGASNSAFGLSSLVSNTTGSSNSAFGLSSLDANTTGTFNTAIGNSAGVLITSGGGNVLLGYQAGDNLTTASSSIIIGFDIDAPSATANNQLNIGNLIFGTGLDGTGSTLSTGSIGIGTTTPTWLLNPSSATAAQLALSAGADVGQWAFRNAGGNLYFATTTVAGNATTSTSALTIIGSTGNVGIGTTSPWAQFSINSNLLGSNVPSFAVGSSTATLFSITSNGSPGATFNYGTISTTTIPINKSYAWSIATSTTATPLLTFNTNGPYATSSINGGFEIDSGAFSYDSSSGIASIDALNSGPMAFDANAGIVSWIDMDVSTTTSGIIMSYSAQLDSSALLTLYGETDGAGGIVNGRGLVGIGTTTPLWSLSSFSTSTPQLALSDGAGIAQWTFRNAGGNLYLATTTVKGNATTTTSALTIIGSSGNVGIGTAVPSNLLDVRLSATNIGSIMALGNVTDGRFIVFGSGNTPSRGFWSGNGGTTEHLVVTSAGDVGIATTSPWRTLAVAGTVGFNSSLGTGVGGNYLCIDTTTFEVLRGNGTACTASSLRFKDNVEDIRYGLDEVLSLRPVSFTYKPESNMGEGTKLGFLAEEMQDIMPEVVSSDKEGKAFGLDYPVLTSVLTKAVQELYAKFMELSDRVLAILDRLTGHDEKIATLEARVAQLEAMVSGSVTVATVMPAVEPSSEETTATTTEPVEETPVVEEISTEEPAPSTPDAPVGTPTPSGVGADVGTEGVGTPTSPEASVGAEPAPEPEPPVPLE